MSNDKIIEGNLLIAEFMGFPKPEAGQKWHYDRSLDHSHNTRFLTIKNVDELGVEFIPMMAYKHYGLGFFDGSVFSPAYYNFNSITDHAPCRKYHSSWDWLMPVVEKIESLGWITVIEKDIVSIYSEDIEFVNKSNTGAIAKINLVLNTVIEFITWYNLTQTNP